jgi:hypothetical protein
VLVDESGLGEDGDGLGHAHVLRSSILETKKKIFFTK